MDLETTTTTADNQAPLSTAHMAAHPRQHAEMGEASAVRHVHLGYTTLLTLQHRAVRLGVQQQTRSCQWTDSGAFCGTASQQKPLTIISQCAKARNIG